MLTQKVIAVQGRHAHTWSEFELNGATSGDILVKIITAAVDPTISGDFKILPGLGNFGDRYFGTSSPEMEPKPEVTPGCRHSYPGPASGSGRSPLLNRPVFDGDITEEAANAVGSSGSSILKL